MNQEHSKPKTPNQGTKKIKLYLKLYLIFLHVFILVLLSTIYLIKGAITEEQAKNLGYGYAVKECWAEQEKDERVDCSSIEIEEVRGECFGWCNDPPRWEVTYSTVKGEVMSGMVYMDIRGNYVSDEEITKSPWI